VLHACTAPPVTQRRSRGPRQPDAPIYLSQQQNAAVTDDVAPIERRFNYSSPDLA
jgi:hypothetical protein